MTIPVLLLYRTVGSGGWIVDTVVNLTTKLESDHLRLFYEA